MAFQPNSATLWPGSVIHGYDAQFGHLNPLSAKLAPVTTTRDEVLQKGKKRKLLWVIPMGGKKDKNSDSDE